MRRRGPKVLRDLYLGHSQHPFSDVPKRVFLKPKDNSYFIFWWLKVIGLGMSIFYLVGVSALAPTSQLSLAAPNDEERQQLEKQLEALESQISEYQSTVDKYRSQGKDLQGEIGRLNAKINALALQIKAVNLSLQKLDQEIDSNQNKVVSTEAKIRENKKVLSRSLQHIYENDSLGLAEILLQKKSLSDFFSDVTNLLEIQENMRATLEKVLGLYEELLDEKEALAIKKNDAEELKAYRNSQRQSIEGTKSEKSSLLNITKGNEERYRQLLKETQKTAAQIRSRIFEFLGGGELTFEEAYKFSKFAEQATGVRAALILAVLDRESALGQNVGRCSYKTAMHPKRDLPIFLEIVQSLNINPDTITVSCPNRDGLYGGAMGPAQFIPSTWKLYRDRIAEMTGSNPPSPWRNSDAFIGTALYLKDSGAADASLAQERIAAARYYAGARWRRYLWTYGDRVVTQAEKFQKDIDILTS